MLRSVVVQAIINPAFLDAGDFTSRLLNRLQTSEWSIPDNDVAYYPVTDAAGNDRWNIHFTANVDSQYSTQDIQQAVLDILFTYFNITPETITATIGNAVDNPFNAGNVYKSPTPVPVQTVTPAGGNSPASVGAPKATGGAQPKPKSFMDTFFDPTTQKVTAVGIGVGVVMLLVVLTQKK